MRILDLLVEKMHARRVTRDLLGWYTRVHSERPELSRETLYAEILMRRNGLDEPAAKALLRRAEQTFEWHSDREVRFRDVALIVTFDEYQRAEVSATGVQANLGRIVARYIPETL